MVYTNDYAGRTLVDAHLLDLYASSIVLDRLRAPRPAPCTPRHARGPSPTSQHRALRTTAGQPPAALTALTALARGARSLAGFEPPLHHDFAAYHGGDLAQVALLQRVLTEPSPPAPPHCPPTLRPR